MSKQSSRGAAWEAMRLVCLERDAWICAYCGGVATTADHVIPKDAGGKDELSNLVSACLRCNGRKSNRLIMRTSGVNPRWLTTTHGR
jgi:5-methylcytosine-specific restriction endonuclease McrA